MKLLDPNFTNLNDRKKECSSVLTVLNSCNLTCEMEYFPNVLDLRIYTQNLSYQAALEGNIFSFSNQISLKYLMLAILQQRPGHNEAWEIPKSEFFSCVHIIIII